MKILSLVDGSDHSLKSLQHIVNILKLSNSTHDSSNQIMRKHELIILSVLVPFRITSIVEKNIRAENPVRSDKLRAYLKEINDEVEKEWITKLSDLRTKYQQDGISVSTKLLEGSHSNSFVAYSIVKFAEDENVDLITAGKIGSGGAHADKLLGGVTRNIAEISNRPLLIVP